jgi:regulator of replication initiation timing
MINKNNLRKLPFMSDLQIQIDNLQKENVAMKTQLSQNQQGVEGLVAQLEAHKGMLGEQLNQGLALRAEMVRLNKLLQLATVDAQAKSEQVKTLTQQLADANAKIASMSALPENQPQDVQVPAA